MRIVFMGTPDFAVESLKAITKSDHEICAVVTIPDKQQGRGLKSKPSPVKEFALIHGYEILQPEKLKDDIFISKLKNYQADCFVVVAFKILPKEIFSIPALGTINVHGSLLPAYRGAAPINWVLINGEQNSGVTTMIINANVDTGDILLQDTVNIDPEMDAGTLHNILAEKGADLLIETLKKVQSGKIQPITQDNSLASKAPKITPELSVIDFNRKALDVHNLIRGLSPYPAAYTFWNSKKLKFYKTKVSLDNAKSFGPGEITDVGKDFLKIKCAQGSIEVYEIQLEGKKRMRVQDFLNGYKFNISERFPS
ncbi:MAG: methionyl-tRNA formyltransferase [Calditrichaeota bacterium]|nr:methionyl-tRNA formyltransferase [Calditrichota bacterium]